MDHTLGKEEYGRRRNKKENSESNQPSAPTLGRSEEEGREREPYNNHPGRGGEVGEPLPPTWEQGGGVIGTVDPG